MGHGARRTGAREGARRSSREACLAAGRGGGRSPRTRLTGGDVPRGGRPPALGHAGRATAWALRP